MSDSKCVSQCKTLEMIDLISIGFSGQGSSFLRQLGVITPNQVSLLQTTKDKAALAETCENLSFIRACSDWVAVL